MSRVLALVFALIGCLGAALVSATEVNTAAGVEAAIARSLTNGRPVVLEFTASWCAGCRELAQTLAQPSLKPYLGCADWVVVNLNGGPGDPRTTRISQRYRLAGLPLLAFVDVDGSEHEDLRLLGPVGGDRVQHSLAGVC